MKEKIKKKGRKEEKKGARELGRKAREIGRGWRMQKPGFRAKDFGLYEAGIAKSLTHYKQKSNMDRSALLKMYPDFRTE